MFGSARTLAEPEEANYPQTISTRLASLSPLNALSCSFNGIWLVSFSLMADGFSKYIRILEFVAEPIIQSNEPREKKSGCGPIRMRSL